jgi:hypothetical protein
MVFAHARMVDSQWFPRYHTHICCINLLGLTLRVAILMPRVPGSPGQRQFTRVDGPWGWPKGAIVMVYMMNDKHMD